MRFHPFFAVMRFLDEITCFLAVDGGEVNVQRCRRLSARDSLLDVACLCVCELGCPLARVLNVSLAVVVRCETNGFVWKLSDSLHQVNKYVLG